MSAYPRCQLPSGCRRKVRTHEGRGKVAKYCSKEHKNLAFQERRQATGRGWSRLGRTMFPCPEPGCSARVWTKGSSCRAHVNRAVTQWAPRILNGLEHHLASHPDDAEASVFRAALKAGLAKPNARGAAGLVRAFQQDADNQHLRHVVFPGMAPGSTYNRSEDDRFHRVLANIYATEARIRRVPTLAALIAGDGRVRQRLPEGFRSRDGVVALCAVVLQLRASGLTHVEIARRFAFPIDHSVPRGRSWLVSQLLAVAGRMNHSAATHQGMRRTRWVEATTRAGEYLKAL
jgi:hypothetical protein